MAYTTTVVRMDSSTYKQKKGDLGRLDYYKIERWEQKRMNYVLEGINYIDIVLANKLKTLENQEEIRVIGINGEPLKTKIDVKISKIAQKGHFEGDLLIATVSSCTYKDGRNSNIVQSRDPFVAVYVLPTIERGEWQGNEHLKFVQLTRYDPMEQGTHNNNFDKMEQGEELEAYKYYFGSGQVPTPHMHFATIENANNYGNSTRNAINVYKLLEYLIDLKNGNNAHGATKFDLGMPYLAILKNPSLYKTSYSKSSQKIRKEILNKITENCDIGKIEQSIDSKEKDLRRFLIDKNGKDVTDKAFDNLISDRGNSGDRQDAMIGIDAVILDVLCLLYVHNSSRGKDFSTEFALAMSIIGGGDGGENTKELESGL